MLTQLFIHDFRDLSERERLAYEAWLEYHVVCEEYDRSVCSGDYGPGNCILPRTPHEQRLISLHALARRDELFSRLAAACVKVNESQNAREIVRCLSYEQQRKELDYLRQQKKCESAHASKT